MLLYTEITTSCMNKKQQKMWRNPSYVKMATDTVTAGHVV